VHVSINWNAKTVFTKQALTAGTSAPTIFGEIPEAILDHFLSSADCSSEKTP
jgi:hypothetical protein